MHVSVYTCVVIASIGFGVASAAAWLYSSIVKVSHERAMAMRTKDAHRKGIKPNYASVSLDGWDMSATFAAQSKWSGVGAVLAACAVALQALSQLLANV